MGILEFTSALLVGVTACHGPTMEVLVLSGKVSDMRGGEAVLGSGHEEICAAAIAAIVDGGNTSPYFSDFLMVGPGFAKGMRGDQTLFPYGKAMLLTGDFGGGQVFLLARAVMDGEVVTMLKSIEVRAFLRGFKAQNAEPATRQERALYYALISWEIAGQPVTVIRDGTRRLLLQGAEKGKLVWIDLIDQYPVPSVAGSVEEALALVDAINRGRP